MRYLVAQHGEGCIKFFESWDDNEEISLWTDQPREAKKYNEYLEARDIADIYSGFVIVYDEREDKE